MSSEVESEQIPIMRSVQAIEAEHLTTLPKRVRVASLLDDYVEMHVGDTRVVITREQLAYLVSGVLTPGEVAVPHVWSPDKTREIRGYPAKVRPSPRSV